MVVVVAMGRRRGDGGSRTKTIENLYLRMSSPSAVRILAMNTVRSVSDIRPKCWSAC